MEISTRAMVAMLVATIALVVAAVALTVASQGPGPMAVEARPDRHVLDVLPSVTRAGGRDIEAGGPLVVRGHARTALLVCEPFKSERMLTSGAVVFPSVPLGDCSLRLDGTRAAYSPVFPGDDLKCTATDGATACTGGLAASKAARVTVTSDLPGVLFVDEVEVGPLPQADLRLKIGTRALRIGVDGDRWMSWKLSLKPEETVAVHFPVPDGLSIDGLVPPPAPLSAPVSTPVHPQVAPPRPRPRPVVTTEDDDSTGNGTAMATDPDSTTP